MGILIDSCIEIYFLVLVINFSDWSISTIFNSERNKKELNNNSSKNPSSKYFETKISKIRK